MTSPSLLKQAQEGDPRAIAALLNQALKAKGAHATANLQGTCLRIHLEGAIAPDQSQSIALIRQGLQRLHPDRIQTLRVYGQAAGAEFPDWIEEVVLSEPTTAVPSPAPEPIPSPAPQYPTESATRLQTPQRASVPRSPMVRPRAKPRFELRWSDFDPAKFGIMVFIAIYGFLGAQNPGYDGPFLWLHYPDLAIHETGHLLFMPFGTFLHILGGSLTQILFPAVFTAYFFWSGQRFSSALALFWTGQNFMDVAVYIADAQARNLPLTVDDPDAHDWWNLLGMMGLLEHDQAIAAVVHGIGVLLYLAAVAAGFYFAYLGPQARAHNS